MIRFAGNVAQRHRYVAQRQAGLAQQVEARAGQFVPYAELAQILRHEGTRKVGAVAVPVQQIKGRRRLAQHVALDSGAIDQIARPQITERPPHEKLVEIALGPGLPLDPVDEIGIQKDAHLARIGKVGQRRQESRGLDGGIAAPRHQRQRGC